jgi:signal transduction histidine kinase
VGGAAAAAPAPAFRSPDQIQLPPGCVKLKANANSGPGGEVTTTGGATFGAVPGPGPGPSSVGYAAVPPQDAQKAQQQFAALQGVAQRAQDHTLHTLEVESILALGLMGLASLGLGWLVAGRVLGPVHRITNTARRLSQETLHERINLDRPNDELKELADTFDAMLARLDQAFTSQRRFVANASHELRTPLATERVLIDEALTNPNASRHELHGILEQLRTNSEESEALIDALLVMARSERGVERWTSTNLADLAKGVIRNTEPEAITNGITMQTDLKSAPAAGDPALLERLIGNLVENGVRHNEPRDGSLIVTTGTEGDRARLTVTNTGPVVPPRLLPTLLEPFRRQQADRTAGADAGFGLGLSIVKAIVDAHGGRLDMAAPPTGGLRVIVDLPATPTKPSASRDPNLTSVARVT